MGIAWLRSAGLVTINSTIEETVDEVTSRFSIQPIAPRIAAQAS
jgi:hypothetical protein